LPLVGAEVLSHLRAALRRHRVTLVAKADGLSLTPELRLSNRAARLVSDNVNAV
jgi:hypothetical protein